MRELADQIAARGRSTPAGVKAASLRDRLSQWTQGGEQAEALQRAFPLQGLRTEDRRTPLSADAAWVLYGEAPWLVGLVAAAGDASGFLVAIDAQAALDRLAADSRPGDLPRDVRLLTASSRDGEWLGAGFPGVKVAYAISDEGDLARKSRLQRWFTWTIVFLVLSVTASGGYFLWRDMRRELRLAGLRAQFVSSVSHELKTPLTAIRLFAETLRMGRTTDRAVAAEYLDTIVNESERSLKSGQVHNIPIKMSYANGVQWLPDGHTLVVRGRDVKGRTGLFRVDLPAGGFEPIMYGTVARFAIAPDARRLFYERRGPEASGGGAIVVRDLQTGEEQDIYKFWGDSGLALSSDGRWLAIKANLRAGDGTVSQLPSIQILPASGGEPRTILTLDKPDSSEWRQMAWSPDGKYVFFTDHHSELWQIPTAGGTPQRLAANLTFINSISVHPDGRRIAISEGSVKGEIWVMENLLPPAKTTTVGWER